MKSLNRYINILRINVNHCVLLDLKLLRERLFCFLLLSCCATVPFVHIGQKYDTIPCCISQDVVQPASSSDSLKKVALFSIYFCRFLSSGIYHVVQAFQVVFFCSTYFSSTVFEFISLLKNKNRRSKYIMLYCLPINISIIYSLYLVFLFYYGTG